MIRLQPIPLLVAAATACSGPTLGEPSADGAPAETPRPTTAAAAKEDAPPQGAVRRVPSPKAFAPTASETLGTREDGIGIAPGAKVPTFSAVTVEGTPFTDADLRERAPIVVIFYRGGWCPYCNAQVREMATRYGDFTAKGVDVVMASADAPDAAALTKRAYEVPFSLVADPDLAMHDAFGVAFEVPPADVARLESFGISLEAWSGRAHHRIAVPSIFFVDASGTVRWAHAARDYKRRPTADQLLQAVHGLAGGAPSATTR